MATAVAQKKGKKDFSYIVHLLQVSADSWVENDPFSHASHTASLTGEPAKIQRNKD